MGIMMVKAAAVALLTAGWCQLAVAQTTAPPAEAGPSLEGTSWKLATLPGLTLVNDVSSTATFGAAGALTGSDGCNRYTAKWTASGNSLTVTPGGKTMMACPEPIMKQADAFTAALAATRTYAIEAGQLVLTDANGTRVAVLVPLPVATLQGTTWEATGVNNGKQAVTSLVKGSTITAIFGADGTVAGSAGCNRYQSTYTTTGDTIAIAPPAATRKMCHAKGVMAQEQQFLTALARAATVQLGENRLELRDAEGALQVSFKAAK